MCCSTAASVPLYCCAGSTTMLTPSPKAVTSQVYHGGRLACWCRWRVRWANTNWCMPLSSSPCMSKQTSLRLRQGWSWWQLGSNFLFLLSKQCVSSCQHAHLLASSPIHLSSEDAGWGALEVRASGLGKWDRSVRLEMRWGFWVCDRWWDKARAKRQRVWEQRLWQQHSQAVPCACREPPEMIASDPVAAEWCWQMKILSSLPISSPGQGTSPQTPCLLWSEPSWYCPKWKQYQSS